MSNESDPKSSDSLYFGPFHLVPSQRSLIRDGKPVAIGSRALEILIALTLRPGEIITREELTKAVWRGLSVEDSNLRVHIASLRKVLAEGQNAARYILNVAGRGYVFAAPLYRETSEPSKAASIQNLASRPQSLPQMVPSLIGRNKIIETLSRLVLSGRFVTVVGPGGIGKTTVAVAVAHAIRQEFDENSIYFVDLTLTREAQQVPNAVASALGCFVRGPDVEPFIAAFVSDKKILLVLDNCEHVISAAAALSERLFQAAPALHVLATSREPMRIEGENVHLLLPLDSPNDEITSASEALGSSAVKLFMERAVNRTGFAGGSNF